MKQNKLLEGQRVGRSFVWGELSEEDLSRDLNELSRHVVAQGSRQGTRKYKDPEADIW